MIIDFFQDTSIKNKSLKTIYNLILQSGPISKIDITEKTKMSRNKVDRLVEKLLEDDLIINRGLGESIGGRPPILFQINECHSYIIGINISRSYTNVALFNLSIKPIESTSFPMTKIHTPEVVIGEVKRIIRGLLKKHNLSIEHILGIGIGSVAPLDPNKGVIINPEQFLAAEWINVPIVEILNEEFPTHYILEATANVSVYGAYKSTSFRFNNILYFISGWFSGAGVIIDGKLTFPNKNGGHDYNHMIIEPNGKPCKCGKRGCLFTYTSLFSLLEEIKERFPNFESTIDISSVPEILQFIEEEYDELQDILLQSAKYLGIGLANLATILHSDQIVLNGPLINRFDDYFNHVLQSIRNHHSNSSIYISKASDDGMFEVSGVASLLFDTLYKL
ncbi:ROK family protein [Bacillus sp. Marseille-P3661]|uniref:ROK family protein n=1 Tax=Bacillus sp. Marseille-P3661 TaxID=1936234 RepID=UPI000C8215DB|nr:ROK family protein [Bacillus sp. Marseille-P3661]